MSWNYTEGCLPTCVKDVASLTENGTSKTLARVLANSVFPTAWVFEYAYEPDTSFYLNQWAHCEKRRHIQTAHSRKGKTYSTRTLLLSNVGAE
jgi:hypothetical protein